MRTFHEDLDFAAHFAGLTCLGLTFPPSEKGYDVWLRVRRESPTVDTYESFAFHTKAEAEAVPLDTSTAFAQATFGNDPSGERDVAFADKMSQKFMLHLTAESGNWPPDDEGAVWAYTATSPVAG